MKLKVLGIVILAVLSATILSITFFKLGERRSEQSTSAKKTTTIYHCAMHPSVTSDHPDKCPICHMDLEKVDGDDAPSANAKRKILFYRNPMKPDVTSPVPAKDEMGMGYVPVYDDEINDTGSPAQVSGRASFSLSNEKQQLIGVKTTPVSTRPLGLEVRANGKVAFDPELFTAIEEYRQSLISRSQMSASPFGGLKEQTDELIVSSKTRLKLMGLSDQQIRALGSNRSNSMNLLLPKGFVWVYAEVFEYETSGMKAGLQLEVIAPSIPGKIFSGRISSVSPIVNAPTRTIRIRAEVPDPQSLLRPDTFVNVKIKVDYGDKLSVPEDAILHSGDQDFVFVVIDQGRFEPRAIQSGVKAANYVEIVSGLKEGESVVSGANFLIDSESRLRAALTQMKDQPHSTHPEQNRAEK